MDAEKEALLALFIERLRVEYVYKKMAKAYNPAASNEEKRQQKAQTMEVAKVFNEKYDELVSKVKEYERKRG